MNTPGNVQRVIVTNPRHRNGWMATGVDSKGRKVLFCQRKTKENAIAVARNMLQLCNLGEESLIVKEEVDYGQL